jgi:hypothetical protein
VDFRELIKMLAGEFKVRIEMRQISLRQEAGRLGGIGSCGRELCCSTWLSDFKTIPTAAARYQNLSLNPAKLSGQCGRLKCCLNYELETYIDAIRDIPVVDRSLKTEKGDATLQKTDIFRRIMWFSYPNETNWYPINCAQVAEIQKMNAAGKKPVGLENLVEISEFVSAKPTSINNDLERLDKKYHQNKKKSGPKKPNNPNVRNEGNAAKPANPQIQQQPRPNQPNNPNIRNEGNAIKPANPQNQLQPRPNQPRPPQQQTRPNQPRPPQVDGGTTSSIPAQTGGNPTGAAEGSKENKSRNKKRKKNRNNNNRPDKPAI